MKMQNSKWRPGILCTRDTRNRLREHFIKQRKYKGRKKKIYPRYESSIKSEYDIDYDENSPGCKCQRRWTARQNGTPLPPIPRIRSRRRSNLVKTKTQPFLSSTFNSDSGTYFSSLTPSTQFSSSGVKLEQPDNTYSKPIPPRQSTMEEIDGLEGRLRSADD
eukprot:UN07266